MGDNTVTEPVLKAIEDRVDTAVARALERAMTLWQNKIDEVEERVKQLEDENASLKEKLDRVATVTALNEIDRDVYSRKWNLVIHGIDGQRGEDEETTERKVREMGTTDLKIQNAGSKSDHPFAACHRLSQGSNAGIIVKFNNLSSKNSWLSSAKNLKNNPKKISVSQDLPQILKPIKTELLNHRKMLPPDQKAKSKMVYSKQWPYITLKLPTGSHFKPKTTIDDILNSYYTCPTPGIIKTRISANPQPPDN